METEHSAVVWLVADNLNWLFEGRLGGGWHWWKVPLCRQQTVESIRSQRRQPWTVALRLKWNWCREDSLQRNVELIHLGLNCIEFDSQLRSTLTFCFLFSGGRLNEQMTNYFQITPRDKKKKKETLKDLFDSDKNRLFFLLHLLLLRPEGEEGRRSASSFFLLNNFR